MNFIELAKNRYSVRSFSTRTIEPVILESVLQTALCAPTARNFQPQRIFVAQSKESLDALKRVCRFTFDAPVVLVLGYEKDKAWRNKFVEGKTSGETDAAIAATHLMLAAHDLGLGSCYVAYFDPSEVANALNIPESIEICALLPIGYPDEKSTPAPLHYESIAKDEMIKFI